MNTSVEDATRLTLDFGKISRVAEIAKGCIPVVVQDADTKAVLLVGYTNEEAMKVAFAERALVLWSTSRGRIWRKGAASGNEYALVEAHVNCEQNSLLYLVRPKMDGGGICHIVAPDGKPHTSCYYRKIDFETLGLASEQ